MAAVPVSACREFLRRPSERLRAATGLSSRKKNINSALVVSRYRDRSSI